MQGSGCRVQGSGFRVSGFGISAQCVGFRGLELGTTVYGLGGLLAWSWGEGFRL